MSYLSAFPNRSLFALSQTILHFPVGSDVTHVEPFCISHGLPWSSQTILHFRKGSYLTCVKLFCISQSVPIGLVLNHSAFPNRFSFVSCRTILHFPIGPYLTHVVPFCTSQCIFSGVHATLQPALSVRPSVRPSVGPSVTLYFFVL